MKATASAQTSLTLLAETAELLGSALLNLLSAWQASVPTVANPVPWFAPYCHHHHAPMAEGLVHCPTCQQAVVRRWYVLRCNECNHRRPATYASTWQRWLPWLWPSSHQPNQQGLCTADGACQHCGHTHWHAEPLAQFQPQHSAYAILAAEPALAPKGVAWARVQPSPQQPFVLKPSVALPTTKAYWPVWLSLPKREYATQAPPTAEPTFALALWPK